MRGARRQSAEWAVPKCAPSRPNSRSSLLAERISRKDACFFYATNERAALPIRQPDLTTRAAQFNLFTASAHRRGGRYSLQADTSTFKYSVFVDNSNNQEVEILSLCENALLSFHRLVPKNRLRDLKK